jgi:hypothetical protein
MIKTDLYEGRLMRVLILIALIFQISCSRENSTSSKKNKFREINFKREELLKGEFSLLTWAILKKLQK